MPIATSLLVLLGTYTPAGGESRGIYAAVFDTQRGALHSLDLAATTPNPTFLAWHPVLDVVYAIGEAGEVSGKPGGALAAFAVDRVHRRLLPLNREPTGGGPLAHVAVDAAGHLAMAISYHAGEVSSFPLLGDGRAGLRTSLLRTQGSLGPNTKRQEKPHPHSATISPDNRTAYVCDLGLDRIFHYRLNPGAADLVPAGETACTPGTGPRHSKFSADGRFLYVLNELSSTLSVFACTPETGALRLQQEVPTLPAEFHGENICAEIRLSPDGRFVYGSNRGHDSIAVFARDAASGHLRPVQIVASGGRHPRNFNLTPDGHWLLCANRDTNNVVVFAVDPQTGELKPNGEQLHVPQAVCVLFPPHD